ncbi:hypothetical protein GCM10027295_11390 [Pseudaeromonas pectinilytica]
MHQGIGQRAKRQRNNDRLSYIKPIKIGVGETDIAAGTEAKVYRIKNRGLAAVPWADQAIESR